MLAVVAPFDHKYPEPAEEVRTTFPPIQKDVGPPAEMVGLAGNGFTVTTTGSDAGLKHPFALVT